MTTLIPISIIIIIFFVVLAISFWSRRFISDRVILFLISIPLYAILFPLMGTLPLFLPAKWFPSWFDTLILGFYATVLTIPLTLLIGFVFAIIEAIKVEVQANDSEVKDDIELEL